MDKLKRYQELRSVIPGDADEWICKHIGVKPQTIRVWNMGLSRRLPSEANLRLIEMAIDRYLPIKTIN